MQKKKDKKVLWNIYAMLSSLPKKKKKQKSDSELEWESKWEWLYGSYIVYNIGDRLRDRDIKTKYKLRSADLHFGPSNFS